MARLARIVLAGVPYHETHCGNQRRDVFFCDRDRQFYLADLAVWAEWLALAVEAEAFGRLRQATGTGRPCAAKEFVENLDQTHARALTPRKRGRKSKYDAIKQPAPNCSK